jgi:hypothetical protein
MHPADQFDGFRTLVDEGMGVEEVAARFGVSVTTVRQRLKLANVSPRLFDLYRADEIALDQLMALAGSRLWECTSLRRHRPVGKGPQPRYGRLVDADRRKLPWAG